MLITGASGGIGRALCTLVKGEGHRIVVAGRDADRLTDLGADVVVQADCTTAAGAQTMLAEATAELGEVPHQLAHCVGNTLLAPLHRTRSDAWSDVLRVNLDSAFHTLNAWIPGRQKSENGGSAVFLSSVVSRIGVANHEAIAAAKGGLEALVRSAAATYASQGIRLNVVAPGLTDTPLTAPMLKSDAFREAATRQYPLSGLQAATDVAAAMAWLLGDCAQRITGQIIPVDGGFTAVRPLVR